VCYCAALPTIETRTRVVILQHPRERDMPIGTARMASLCLPNARLHVGVRWTDPAIFAGAPPILLYPGKGARDILREPPAGPVTLVVVDGTWSQAKTVVRDNPLLQALPRYAFATPEPSKYRIRREPRAEFVSTIEALMYVLGALEGDAARFRALLDPLNAMVDAQLRMHAERPSHRVKLPRAPRPPRIPRAVIDRWHDLVCVVAEANAWPYHAGDSPPDELIQIAAERVATGERFELLARPEHALSPSTLFHTELDAAALAAGVPRDELLARFAAFTRPRDHHCTWGHYGANLIGLPGVLDVRDAAQRLEHRRVGSLEDYGGPVPALPSRALRRLALLVAIVKRWRDAT
jgi:DTW domain-containing protein YfiP